MTRQPAEALQCCWYSSFSMLWNHRRRSPRKWTTSWAIRILYRHRSPK